MPSLKAKQLLLKAAQLSQSKEEKLSRLEIKKKINRIKHLASQKKVSPTALKKELTSFEENLKYFLSLEKRLKEKQEEESKQIAALKKQIKELKQQLSHPKNQALKKRINRLSFLIGELVAHSDIRKEVEVQKALSSLDRKKMIPGLPPQEIRPQPENLPENLPKKIRQLKQKILALKNSGRYPPEKLALLEQRLNALETKVSLEKKEPVKHRMLFGPPSREPLPPQPSPFSQPDLSPKLQRLEEKTAELEKIEELLRQKIPPPPKKVKK